MLIFTTKSNLESNKFDIEANLDNLHSSRFLFHWLHIEQGSICIYKYNNTFRMNRNLVVAV